MSTVKYNEPEWSAKPIFKFWLDVLKDGKIVDKIILDNKKFYLVGKQDDICDLVMAHPSVSRVHAVFQFRSDGALLLKDLNSGNGTAVNKVSLPKDESNNSNDMSTFHVLHNGDFVRFGVSTRQLIVGSDDDSQSLPEYDSENMQKYRDHLQNKSARASERENARLEKENEGASWGFGEDAVAVAEDDDDGEGKDNDELPDYLKKLKQSDVNYDRKHAEKFTSGVVASLSLQQQEKLTEKQREIVHKISQKEKKVQNMQEEIRRILYKETEQEDGLTANQSTVLTRNEARVIDLMAEVAVAEDALMKSLHGPGTAAGANSGKSLIGAKLATKEQIQASRRQAEYEQEEGVLDVTDCHPTEPSSNWRMRRKAAAKNGAGGAPSGPISAATVPAALRLHPNDKSGSGSALNYEDIQGILTAVRSEHGALLGDLHAHRGALAAIEQRAAEDQMDEIEACLLANSITEAKSTVAKLLVKEAGLHTQLKYYDALRAVATPALSSLVGSSAAKSSTAAANPVPVVSTEVTISSLSCSSSDSAGKVGVALVEQIVPANPHYIKLPDKDSTSSGRSDYTNTHSKAGSNASTGAGAGGKGSRMSISSCMAGVEELKRTHSEREGEWGGSACGGDSEAPVPKKRNIGPSLPSAAEASNQEY